MGLVNIGHYSMSTFFVSVMRCVHFMFSVLLLSFRLLEIIIRSIFALHLRL